MCGLKWHKNFRIQRIFCRPAQITELKRGASSDSGFCQIARQLFCATKKGRTNIRLFLLIFFPIMQKSFCPAAYGGGQPAGEKRGRPILFLLFRDGCDNIYCARRHSQVVRQRTANPLPPVQIWVAPPFFLPEWRNRQTQGT